MNEQRTLEGLKQKYGRLLGEREAAEKLLAKLETDIERLADAIRVFEANPDKYETKPLRVYRRRSPIGRAKFLKIFRRAIAELDSPFTTTQLTERIVTLCEAEGGCTHEFEHVRPRVLQNLKLRSARLVMSDGGWPRRWTYIGPK